MYRSVRLIDFCVDVGCYAAGYIDGLVSPVESLEVDAQVESEYSSYLIAVFFDKVGHYPCCRVVIAISVDESEVHGIVGVDCMMVARALPRGSSYFHELIIVVVEQGEDLTPMLCAVISWLNMNPVSLEIVYISGLTGLVTIHFKPVDINTSLGHYQKGAASSSLV